ncbi:TRP-domain-containing protein [Aureobasidium sp. EXF-12298]|nr:TRP-domain-containing protein [Aureobasidium sp. EXF-12298]KAI4753595.1 TRP-domain-containing protein [Aureobasidium sp. EXF-12344]KAI4770729.1 TRP-domain-containing protein [Aureobasidium sp. EXF-3400]
MRPSRSPLGFLIALLAALVPMTQASGINNERVISSSSLSTCMANSNFSATLFNVAFTPDNRTLTFNVVGITTISGNVTIDLVISAYGLSIFKKTLDPCQEGWAGLCPMNEGQIDLDSNIVLPADAISQIPGIAYTVPDLDAKVQVYVNSTDTGRATACVQAELTNGKTVDQKGVSWAVAVIAGLALLVSAITSGLGHSNTAAHVAANTLALFGYFQAQSLVGMTAVPLPPIVASWTQNFQWSMGIIRVGFLQDIATWYQRSTGGTPSTVLSELSTESVEVQKRSLHAAQRLIARGVMKLHQLLPRATSTTTDAATKTIVLRGIERVGFRAKIELTNIFLTGYIFLLIFVVFVVLGVIIFKFICEGLVKMGKMKGDKFQDFRNGWTTVLKGILFRLVLIGFPQMVVLCFWEFTKRDSAAEVVLAAFTVFTMIGILAWASSKVIRLARRSVSMHKNPAYILYSDPVSLNKWGFLYVQFKATAYYFIVPVLAYLLLKGMFVAFGQNNGTLQAIAFLIIEAVFFIVVCVLTPYMDKKTNAFNIAICFFNFLNSIFLLFFTGIFSLPGLVNGVMGILFFIFNAVFSLILLISIIVASAFAIFSKNPDTRYQPMRDDRGSFIKSQTQLNTELDALGATARGEGKTGWKGARIEDDEDGWSGSSTSEPRIGGNSSSMAGRYGEIPRSPHDPSISSFPSDGGLPRHNPPTYLDEKTGFTSPDVRSNHSPSPARSPQVQQTGRASPWQRGAGYE